MSSNAQRQYAGVTPAKWQAIRQAAANFGFAIPDQPTGQTEGWGVHVIWAYSEPHQKLEISIPETGILDSTDAIGFIDDVIQPIILT